MAKEMDLRTLATINCKKSDSFVVASDGSGAYCFIDSESAFFIDFENGKETEMTMEKYKSFDGICKFTDQAVRFYNDIHDSTNVTQFLRIVIQNESKRLLCILYSADIRKQTISIIDEREEPFPICEYYVPPYIYRAKCGKYFLMTNKSLECVLMVNEISVNESQKLIIQTVARHELLMHALLISPFVEDDAVFYFSDYKMEELNKVTFDKSQTTSISLSHEVKFSFTCTILGSPIYFNENVFYFYSDKEKNEIAIVALHIKQLRWSRKSLMAYHGKISYYLMNILPDGTAFIFVRFEERTVIYQLDLSIGNKYILNQKELGKGGFGVVVEGIINESRKVAVKIVLSFSDASTDRKRQILLSAISEARKLKMLDHINIVKGYGFLIEENRFLLFMELMTESVRQKLLRTVGRRLEEKEAFWMLQQALEGLIYLHTLKPQPIVHRDIKCANILLDRDGRAKLGDLGLVNALSLNTAGTTDSSLAPNQSAGTKYWQAPEVLDHDSTYGRKADIWSIGCSFVEMLTGFPPYSSLNETSLVVGLVTGRLAYDPSQLVPGASDDVVDVLEKCFRRETKTQPSMQVESNQLIRPHSWELLADVIGINELKPIKEEMLNIKKEADEKMRNTEKEMDVVMKRMSEWRNFSKQNP